MTTINTEKRYPLAHMVVMYGDVEEYLPDATDQEMHTIAGLMGDALMYEWGDVLREVLTIVKQDRNTVKPEITK